MMVIRSHLLDEHGFAHGFSLRTGGVSAPPFDSANLARNVGDAPEAVLENHRRFALTVGYTPGELYEVSQVHGATVRVVRGGETPEQVRADEADALLAAKGVGAVGVRIADCTPVLIADRRTRSVAAVHAGWRGTVAGVVREAVRVLLTESGARAEDLIAAIGPHIRVGAFEVGEDVAAEIAAAAPGRDVIRKATPRPFADLSRVVTAHLEEVGFSLDRIDDVGGCTHTEVDRFFSFRRDGKRSGRHVAAIVA
jgi:YfiH family protein